MIDQNASGSSGAFLRLATANRTDLQQMAGQPTTPAFSATRAFLFVGGLKPPERILNKSSKDNAILESNPMTTATLYTPLTNAALDLAARVKAAWTQGPVPCWFDYLHETDDKA